MARHICLKEWNNHNEISVSIDDNLCDRFRGWVVVFTSDERTMQNTNMVDFGECRFVEDLAEKILKARDYCRENRGQRSEFPTRILSNNESLEE